jgi:hypothetical protein
LWGAGALPDSVDCGLGRIYSDDLLAWALGHRANVDVQPRSAFVGAASAANGARGNRAIADKSAPTKASNEAPYSLLDLQDTQPAEFDQVWWPAIEARLDAGTEIRLAFADGVRMVLRRSHRLRFWRKA